MGLFEDGLPSSDGTKAVLSWHSIRLINYPESRLAMWAKLREPLETRCLRPLQHS